MWGVFTPEDCTAAFVLKEALDIRGSPDASKDKNGETTPRAALHCMSSSVDVKF